MDRLLRKFGLGKGRLDLELVDSSFCLGGFVEGKLTYELKKPQEASELWVEVRATQDVLTPREVTRFARHHEPRREIQERASTLVLYKHRERLDGYHMYDVGEHKFRLPLPDVIASPNQDMETPNDSWMRPFRGSFVRFSRIRWRVGAKLVIPWSLGVTDSKKFFVVPRLPRKAAANFCAKCGGERRSGDKFCPHCGQEY